MHGACPACAGRRGFNLGLLQWVAYLLMCHPLISGAGFTLVLSPLNDILHWFIKLFIIIIFRFLS